MNSQGRKRIALIYEGVKAEEELLNNMKQTFLSEFSEVDTFHLPADGNIYMLWKRMVDDEFNTDTIELLREMSTEAKDRLERENLVASDFSEVYMFFDYDGHAVNFSEKTVTDANEMCIRMGKPKIKNKWDLLERMLQELDNETENGKLYISYPMVEAIKEIETSTEDYHKLHIPLDEIAQYKGSFQKSSDYENYPTITRKMWEVACKASVKQANIIVKQTGIVSYEKFINECTQLEIYHAQKLYYINAYKLIAILSSIPLFLIEYFDKDFWNEVIT